MKRLIIAIAAVAAMGTAGELLADEAAPTEQFTITKDFTTAIAVNAEVEKAMLLLSRHINMPWMAGELMKFMKSYDADERRPLDGDLVRFTATPAGINKTCLVFAPKRDADAGEWEPPVEEIVSSLRINEEGMEVRIRYRPRKGTWLDDVCCRQTLGPDPLSFAATNALGAAASADVGPRIVLFGLFEGIAAFGLHLDGLTWGMNGDIAEANADLDALIPSAVHVMKSIREARSRGDDVPEQRFAVYMAAGADYKAQLCARGTTDRRVAARFTELMPESRGDGVCAVAFLDAYEIVREVCCVMSAHGLFKEVVPSAASASYLDALHGTLQASGEGGIGLVVRRTDDGVEALVRIPEDEVRRLFSVILNARTAVRAYK